MKYNPSTECNVVVDGIDRPEPPLFLRMFICLAPAAKGFLSGFRPLIGVDGCHLNGPYPDHILVAVGKDGNNNIYPIAWATTEIENTETWGLLEALQQVMPYAETRYCVRHTWENIKLQFNEATFKELFWSAARATTLFDFEVTMESIKFLSEEAYDYLVNIPPEHWSRNSFSSFPKSNMLLNNICETFNAVIKEGRDKPILTQMEWLRRYFMKRNLDKWESFQRMEGKVTPYVKKTFQIIESVAKYYVVQFSRGDSYEFELNSDLLTVDLSKHTYNCYHGNSLVPLVSMHMHA
ncbi:uncharacterized protein LOC110728366 [Chenopodium quinoa]|uniref:uncharacterized protein LOC110728366 n=1 Tax=Chenopodium quinoa TaxID=63459 RepID=UPI000B791FBE|nr:uncharacterized protein LOC110728366 [Chenopodium quinoa]